MVEVQQPELRKGGEEELDLREAEVTHVTETQHGESSAGGGEGVKGGKWDDLVADGELAEGGEGEKKRGDGGRFKGCTIELKEVRREW